MRSHVLIVDDSLTVRMDLQEVFEAAGLATTLCPTVAAARATLAQELFQLIVLDVLLPDADGIAFLRELKAASTTADIPIMLLSSEAEVCDRVRGLTIGADEYVGKPYERSYIIARAHELISRRVTVVPLRTPPTVLVIDDSATSREELQTAFESAGYTVLLAATGEEGLRLAIGAHPDAVVVDGVLPGIDGATVIRRIRSDAALRRTPCLLLTGSEGRHDEYVALEAGADTFVRKGEDMAVLLARLAAALRSAGSPGAVRLAGSLLGPKRILAVDDSPTYLQELAAPLRQEGYDVILARCGEEALELLAVQSVDCILLDFVMPGLSGQETCRRIKASPVWRDIPLLMITAREDRARMLEGFNAGADDYILKSSEFEILKARVRAQLRRKQFEDENRSIREELLRKEAEAAEAHANRELAETRARLLLELEHANKELEAFSYSVSHDLRAPLRAIDGFSGILLEDYSDKLDAEGRRLLDVIRSNTQRMGQLIDDLLAFSRLSRQEFAKSPIDMAQLVQSVVAEMRRVEPNRSVAITMHPLAPSYGDSAMLRQVFANLISNALKFSQHQPQASVEIGCYGENQECVYYVKDNGVGFDMQYVDKLFGVFQRLHSADAFEGTGVGLAIVQRVILRHGGRVWAQGNVNAGATFSFTLPSSR